MEPVLVRETLMRDLKSEGSLRFNKNERIPLVKK